MSNKNLDIVTIKEAWDQAQIIPAHGHRRSVMFTYFASYSRFFFKLRIVPLRIRGHCHCHLLAHSQRVI